MAVSDDSAPQKCNLTMENDAARTRIIVCVFDITHLFTQQGLLISWAWTTATGLKKQMSLLQRFVEILELACLICGWVGWLAAFSAGFWAVWTVGPLKKIGSYTLCSGPAAATVEHVSRERLQRGWSYTILYCVPRKNLYPLNSLKSTANLTHKKKRRNKEQSCMFCCWKIVSLGVPS